MANNLNFSNDLLNGNNGGEQPNRRDRPIILSDQLSYSKTVKKEALGI